MRDIKFRAWNTLDVKMYHFDLGDRVSKRRSIELMQYTGLKDKNGVEIYEGDIVKEEHSDGPRWYKVVEWDEYLTGFAPFNEYDADCGEYYSVKTCEVIGNTYENKDLLK